MSSRFIIHICWLVIQHTLTNACQCGRRKWFTSIRWGKIIINIHLMLCVYIQFFIHFIIFQTSGYLSALLLHHTYFKEWWRMNVTKKNKKYFSQIDLHKEIVQHTFLLSVNIFMALLIKINRKKNICIKYECVECEGSVRVRVTYSSTTNYRLV